jgi:hypothetical protein
MLEFFGSFCPILNQIRKVECNLGLDFLSMGIIMA